MENKKELEERIKNIEKEIKKTNEKLDSLVNDMKYVIEILDTVNFNCRTIKSRV